MKRKAVTIIEIIVSAVILALVFAGFLASFVAVKRYVLHANNRLVAMNMVRRECDNLYRAVRADTWDTGDLAPGAVNVTSWTVGELYNVECSVYNVTGHEYRGVDMSVDYLSE